MNEEFINQIIEQKLFVDVFDDDADESFYGYIIAQSEELLHLEHYDNEGRFDGVLILVKEDISRIRWGGNEINQTEGLIGERIGTGVISLTNIRSAVLSVHDQFNHVCLTLGCYGTDKMFIGEIHEDKGDSLTLHEYGTRKSCSRSYLLLRWDDISRVQAGGVYEKNLHKQYN